MEEIIREIADLLDAEEVVFFHKEHHDILSYPAPHVDGYHEHDYLAQEVMDVVDMDPDAYLQFDPLPSKEGYKMMEAFVDTLPSDQLRARLLDALQAKKPFRSFRNAVEIEELEDSWYDFKDAYLQMYVRDRME